MKKHVALLVGGASSEREVSIQTGGTIQRALIELGHKVTVIDPDRNISQIIKELNPDIVFNGLHGTYGEDGVIPGIIEMLGIPYTHSGVMASAIAMDKIMTKKIAISCGIRTPKHLEIHVDDLFDMLEKDQHPMPKPYVIKARNQGSTIGIYLMIDDNSTEPIRADWKFPSQVLIEQYIPGIELSAAVFDDKALGVIELRPKSSFYDYEAKYTDGMTEHVYPADVSERIYNEAMQSAELIHKTLNCRTTSRADFRYNPESGELFFLELNTHPGFTDLSIVPEIAAKCGFSIESLVMKLLEDAKCEIKA